MFEFFEHTADLGIRATGPTKESVLASVAQGLFAAIIDDLETIQPRQQIENTFVEPDLGDQLFDWLRWLLYVSEVERLLLRQFEIIPLSVGFLGRASGEPWDETRHQHNHEVKAITYHDLRLEETASGWLAEVIVDI